MPVSQSCQLPAGDPLFQQYHDEEWGVPVTSERAIFEKVCLEGFQSGLSWRTILHRRTGFREAFDDFDMHRVAAYKESDIERLMQDERIIRNRRKILSAINNARRALELQQEAGSLASFFWQFEPIDSRPDRVTLEWLAENPATPESTALARALKSRGWSFVGPTNLYALMQALGIVNDHVHGCPRRRVIRASRQILQRPGPPIHTR